MSPRVLAPLSAFRPDGTVDWEKADRIFEQNRAEYEWQVKKEYGLVADPLPFMRPKAAEEPESSWRFIDLTAIVAGERPPAPTILPYPGGAGGLFYRGLCHAINGESESGKSWLALAACVGEIAAGRNVVYLDFEDGPEDIVSRLLALGLTADTIVSRFHYMRPDHSMGDADADRLADDLVGLNPGVVVLDGVTEAMAAEGLDGRHERDVATYIRLYTRFCQRHAPEAAIIQIDHVTKNRDSRGKDAIGSQHKRAGLQVTFTVDPVFEFGRGRHGKSTVIVTKDRRGWLRGVAKNGKNIGELHVVSKDDSDRVKVYIVGADNDVTFRPTFLMERVSRALEDAGQTGMSRNQIEQIKGNKAHLVGAAGFLVKDGYAHTEYGGGHMRWFHSNPYVAPQEDDQ